jgi:hypothetical protein
MIQLRNTSEPILRLIKRAAALDARATNAASSPAEQVVARQECDALCVSRDLEVTRMLVPAPRGHLRMSGVSDTVLNHEGTPWWRGQLGLLAAMHAGFGAPKERPWESDGKSLFLRLVGTKHAVWQARMFYATAEIVAVNYADVALCGRLDEYLCGVSIAIGLAFEMAFARDQAKLDVASQKAMVVYLKKEPEPMRPPPTTLARVPEDELDILAVAQNRWHPVRRGFDAAKQNRAGELVLGELPRIRRKLS